MLQSIEHQIGLPIAFDPAANAIHWPEGIAAGHTSVRTFAEMRDYIREPDARPTQDAIYTVHRGVARREDAEHIRAARLRYDITVIPPGHFAGRRYEFFRTAGHYHATVPHESLAYPEVYEVVSGRALWLIQRPSAGNAAVLEEIYAIEAGPGEKAVMPPGFGHISINTQPEPLILANWISDSFAYDYDPYRRLSGGGYWALEGEMPGTIEFERNPRYADVPELLKLQPKEVPELGLRRPQPLYTLAHELSRLSFLGDPEAFRELLALDRLYRRVV